MRRIPRRAPARLTAAAALLLAVACGGSDGPRVPVPATFDRVSGFDQTGVVGRALALPVVVRAADATGAPVAGLTVRFGRSRPGGALPLGEGVTDALGQATFSWVLDTGVGPQQLTAAVLHPDTGQPLLSVGFDALAVADVAARIDVLGGQDQIGAPLEVLPLPLDLQVTDRYGNQVEGAEVEVTSSTAGAAFQPARFTTGPDGRAFVLWTLGLPAWQQEAVISVTGLAEPVAVHASRSPGNLAVDLALLSGDGQVGPVDAALPDPVVVQVTYRGVPVPGARVDFASALGSGAVAPASARTGADGTASASWAFGTVAGPNRVAADVLDPEAGLIATRQAVAQADCLAGPPASLTIQAGDGLVSPQWVHAYVPVRLLVADRFGNLAPGVEVTFTAVRGSGVVDPATATTDAAGVARAQWEFGRTLGEELLEARVAGLLPVQFHATVTAPGSPYDGTYWAAATCGAPITVANGAVVGVGPDWTLTDSVPIDGVGAATWEFNLRPPETMPAFRYCRGTFALDGEGGASVSGTYVTMMGGGTPWSAVRGF
jgi:hypothetical protein